MDSEVVDAFKLFDRDKDGRVTREEIVDLIESLEGDSNCPHVQVRKRPTYWYRQIPRQLKNVRHQSQFIFKLIFLKELLKASDENGNGSVDLSQFMALWTSFKAKVGDDGDTEDDIKTAFQEYDIDHDGYITKDEMVEVSSLRMLQALFFQMDYNKVYLFNEYV